MKEMFLNTGSLVRFILRRERIISAIWIVCLAGFAISLAPGLDRMFEPESRNQLALTLSSPAMVSMMGPVFGADNYTAGAMYSGTMILWVLITSAVMNIFFVVRHTRSDEERGREEVVRSLPTGRLANLSAALAAALVVNAVMGLVIALGMGLTGGEFMDFSSSIGFTGSVLYGFVTFATGMFFAAITAVFCQLSSSSRGAVGYSILALGLIYILRAAGDVGAEPLSYISALGLAQRSQIYVENYWWPSAVLLLEAAALAAAAFAFNAIRDMDQGMIPARRGRADAKRGLGTAFGLSLRLLRGQMLIWIIVMFMMGAAYASVLTDIDGFIESSEFYQSIIGLGEEHFLDLDALPADYAGPLPAASMEEMFVGMVYNIMTMFCLIPILIAALKPRGEEQDGRSEQVLSKVVSRVNYLSGYVIIAFITSVVIQFAVAFGLYLTAAAIDVPLTFGFLMSANLAYVPALWVMIGLTVLMVGLFPKATMAIWGYFGFAFFTSFLGRMLELPVWISGLTPFHYIPQAATEDITALPLVLLTVTAAALTAAGFFFYHRRETLTAA